MFRSLYEAHAFNGDPHPGNYLFHGGGRVTFLDFGLVKHFTPAELQPLMQMVRSLCVDNQPEAFRRGLEDAGFLVPHAPLSTEMIVDHLGVFYATVRRPGRLTITPDYASAVVRRFFDLRSPVAEYVAIPQSYVILQRINLGLFAVLGELSATADWRAIAEEIWPFVQGAAVHPDGGGRGGVAGAAADGRQGLSRGPLGAARRPRPVHRRRRGAAPPGAAGPAGGGGRRRRPGQTRRGQHGVV